MVLEVAILNVKPGQASEFEAAFAEATEIISASEGFESLELQRCVEAENRYVLLVRWQTIEDHTWRFRGSEAYERRQALLHHFYDPFPVVEHYEPVLVRRATS